VEETMVDFASDNAVGASPLVIEALIATNRGAVTGYGSDPYTARAKELLADVFEREVTCFFVSTGTAANALALSALCPPWGGIFCHHHAHIANDECGAPEMLTGGAKLVGIDGPTAKISPDAFRKTLLDFPAGIVRQVQPGALSLSQATECGTLYSCGEIEALSEIAHAAGIPVHMDGARFANALVSLGCSPAEMSWKAGVDVLSFGATKNGTFACEAVIFFDSDWARTFAYRCKRAGHTLSKGRLLGAQMAAYLENDHWLDLARIANAQACDLARGLKDIPGVRLAWDAPTNQVFAILPRAADEALKRAGVRYYDWGSRGLDPSQCPASDEVFVRLVTSFATESGAVRSFVSTVREAVSRHQVTPVAAAILR
jgi:threonine aldolase